jgi:allophanate hydrolase
LLRRGKLASELLVCKLVYNDVGSMPQSPFTIAALHEDYRRGVLRPSQVVESWLAQPAAARSSPVWISTVAPENLRARAAALDAELASDPARALSKPLFGTLYAAKDNIDVAGVPTTAACPAFAYEPAQSSPVVEALHDGGAMLVGKTNLDQFATGLVGTRSPYGAVPNAVAPMYASGGSSSGSAVAVAAGLVHFALGTDTAGSGRVPAGLNNIVGWKPSRGILSTRGTVPACRSLDCVSIFAMTVPDAARVFAVTSAFDDQDPCSRRLSLCPHRFPSPFRFGVPGPSQRNFDGDDDAAAAFEVAIARLTALGGTAVAVDLSPWQAVAAMLYEGPWVAERHAAIREFFDAQPDALDPNVSRIIAGASRYTATDVFAATARLGAMQVALRSLWKTFDVLLVPTAPTAYTIAAIQADPIELNRRLGTYTNFVNLLDLAALAVPSALKPNGLPFGVTLIAPAGSDLALAELGQRLHQEAGLPLGATAAPMPKCEPLATPADVARVAVVGAHLTGLPLNHELTSRGGRLVRCARTAPHYSLYALSGMVPPKPGLVRTSDARGHGIELEIWELGLREFGSFVLGVPSPLSIGTIELDDGPPVHGFLCEATATAGAEDISRFGGWRNYLNAKAPP